MKHQLPGLLGSTLVWTALAILSGCGPRYIPKEPKAKDMPDALEPVELDLGTFDVTIPAAATNSTLLVDFHAFAKLPRYKKQEVSKELKAHQNQFRHEVLLRTRKLDRPKLNDPDLTLLRSEIQSALLEVCPDNKVEMVGFYHFRFLEE